MYYVYILKSSKDGKLYTGHTVNLKQRLHRHNMGGVRSTKNRWPFTAVHVEEFSSVAEARKKEWFYKCTPQGGKLKKKILEMA